MKPFQFTRIRALVALFSVIAVTACGGDKPVAEPMTNEADSQAWPAELVAAEQALAEAKPEVSLQLSEQELIMAAPEPRRPANPVLSASDSWLESPDSYAEMSWLDLVPDNFHFSALLDQVQERFPDVDFAMMDDWDPQAMKALDFLRELTDAAPVREDLDGTLLRMPGFLLPLDFDSRLVTSFLLVPYFGACIHTPPPPANQIIYVEVDKPFELDSLFEPVWVAGRLSTQQFESELAMAGYFLEADLVELYDEIVD